MGIQGMKMQHHHLTRGFWPEHQTPPTSLTLGCKRLRPLAPKLTNSAAAATTAAACFDLKSFIRQPQTSPRQPHGSPDSRTTPPAAEVQQQQQQPGGTRWNPTQEQIGILEMLYKGGMRTPNAQQIEHITAHLAKYGKIEGKNVFYWFQNHKARERQKQKRYNNNNLGRGGHGCGAPSPLTNSCDLALSNSTKGDLGDDEEKSGGQMGKRKSRSWELEENVRMELGEEEEEEEEEVGEADRTLKLFPLHPEGRS